MKNILKIIISLLWIFIVISYVTWVFEYLQYYEYGDSFMQKVLANFNIVVFGFFGAISPLWGIFGLFFIINYKQTK